MSARRTLLMCVASATLGGCGVVPPRVSYAPYDQAQSGAQTINNAPHYPFRSRRSLLLIRSNDDSKLTVAASPWELTTDGKYSPLYTLQGSDDFRSTTQLKVSYIDNTKFIDELGVTTKDNVADTVGKVAALVKAVIPVVASFVSGTTADPTLVIKPTVVDPAKTATNVWLKDPLNNNICLRLHEVVVESTLTLDEYLERPNPRQSFPVPACATAALDLAVVAPNSTCDDASLKAGAITTTQATFAHHANVLPMPLPSTGSLKMHPICGASVTEAGTQDRFQLLTVLTTIMTEAKAADTAWKAATAATPAASTTAPAKK